MAGHTSLTKTQFGTLRDDMVRANMTAIAQKIKPEAWKRGHRLAASRWGE